jgi:hypothetical protein
VPHLAAAGEEMTYQSGPAGLILEAGRVVLRPADVCKRCPMRHLSLLSATLATALSLAAPAWSYVAANGLLVQADGEGTFNVPFMGLSGDTDFWCAAGDYVNNFLGMPGGTRIFRLSEPPRPGGQGIRFSLSAEGASERSGLAIFSSDGPPGSVSASMAYALCPSRFFMFGLQGFFR